VPLCYFLKKILFIRFLNKGADTPEINATKTQFKTITGRKYKMMATYTLRHILQLNGLKLIFHFSGSLAISIK
jgi:hypothetical protein